jgi:sugar lactone lactonase YvrE
VTRTQTTVAMGAIILSFGSVWLFLADSGNHPDRLGAVESWSECPFSDHQRAEVLATGLDDVRGLAFHDGTLILAEANGMVLKYSDSQLYEDPPPNDQPQKVDQRGAAVDGDSLFIAQHGRGRISKRNPIDSQTDSGVNLTNISGPAGIAVSNDMLYVTDDRPWPGTAIETSFDSSDYSRWLDKGTQRLFGGVLACQKPADQSCSFLPGIRLRHPSGIAADQTGKFLFVTESDANQVRWVILENKAGQWTETGALGSMSTAGKVLPAFLGIATNIPTAKGNKYVFCAGPTGLYIFSWPPADRMLGRVVFDEPVSGVAVHEKFVYLIVGHRLCRLKMDHAN